MTEIDFYENYSQTQSLQSGFSQKDLQWGIEYFKNYFLPHFPKDKSINILEIGCGWGKFVKASTEVGYTNIIGIDISKQQIEIAKQLNPQSKIFLIDPLEYLKNESTKIDIVILSDVLEHLENDYSVKLFRELHTKMNVGGKIIVQVPNGLSLLNPIRYADITHIQSFTQQSLNQIFRLSGFTNISCFAVSPVGKGIKKNIRKLLWKFLVNPAILAYMLIANGDTMGGIYTSNIIGIAEK